VTDAPGSTDGHPVVDVTRPPDPCAGEAGCPAGVWINATPAAVDLVNGDCGNYGTKTVQVDPVHPQDVYTLFFCQGVWKSTDYGQTFTGPINTGMNGAMFGDCAGGITIAPASTASPPVIYASCIRGNGIGFWKSTNGGVDWTTYNVAPAPAGVSGQNFYPPVSDPYDPNHLLMAAHAQDLLVESTDGGQNWTKVNTLTAMNNPGGTGGPEFIDTGNAATTRTTWLWLASGTGGSIGTWRTTDGGATWTNVDSNEHVTGETEIYQPDTSGVVFMAGWYSKLGNGVLRSTDYGKTWAHVGIDTYEGVVVGTSKNLYAMYGWAIGAGMTVDPTLESAPVPGTGTWTMPGTPSAMTQGTAQIVTTFDGTHNILLAANYNAGLWRYVEP
jgi:hypothetical protein